MHLISRRSIPFTLASHDPLFPRFLSNVKFVFTLDIIMKLGNMETGLSKDAVTRTVDPFVP